MAKYNLIGLDGNCLAILAYVTKAMIREELSKDEVNAYIAKAKSSDYNHLICVSMEMVDRLNAKYVEEESESEPSHTITEDFAWQVYNIINRWKNGEYGERPLQDVLDNEL